MTVADRIKEIRENRKLSQEDLAKMCGWANRSSISKVESSGDDITSKKIKTIADALNVPVSYLMGWSEEEKEVPDYVPGTVELIDLFSRVTDEQRNAVLALLRSFVD